MSNEHEDTHGASEETETEHAPEAAAEEAHPAPAHGDDHGHGGGHGHHDPKEHEKHYIKIWGILVVMLVISVIGPEIGIQIVTLITAFGIAFVKAYMVAKHFMHLDVEKPVIHYFLAVALAFMVLFFAGVAPDVRNHEGTNWENVAAKAEIERRFEAEGDIRKGTLKDKHHGDDHGDEHHDDDKGGGEH